MFDKIQKYIQKNNYLDKYDIAKEYLVLNEQMVSRAVFISLFISLLPIPGHMLIIFFITFLLKFNFPIAIAVSWLVSNPFSLPFILYIQYITGQFILDRDPIQVQITIEWFTQNFSNILIPLYTGAIFYSFILSLFAFYGVKIFYNYKENR